MVTQKYSCPNGHHWQDAEPGKCCPICGAAAAETVGDGKEPDATDPGSASGDNKPSTDHGDRIGRYEIKQELGRGGMGIVYRAYDPAHQRYVALKTLPHADGTLLSRFKREFRLLAGVDHPNIVKLFELASDGNTWYFTMEIVTGVDLLTYLRSASDQRLQESGPNLDVTQDLTPICLSVEKQARLRDAFGQLAHAVATLHGEGIVHRDIKPSNVMVTADGRVVLLDFGLVAETDSSGIYQSIHQNLMGTAAYMSPEQAACDPVTIASDWYSIGVMLYQSLTGKLPFSGESGRHPLQQTEAQPPAAV